MKVFVIEYRRPTGAVRMPGFPWENRKAAIAEELRKPNPKTQMSINPTCYGPAVVIGIRCGC